MQAPFFEAVDVTPPCAEWSKVRKSVSDDMPPKTSTRRARLHVCTRGREITALCITGVQRDLPGGRSELSPRLASH